MKWKYDNTAEEEIRAKDNVDKIIFMIRTIIKNQTAFIKKQAGISKK
jgi:hypothetical protein